MVIDAETGNVCRTIEGMPNETLAFRPNGKSVAGAAGRGERLRLTLCDLQTGRLKPLLNKQLSSGRTIEHLAFRRTGAAWQPWSATRPAACSRMPTGSDSGTRARGELQVEVERPGSASIPARPASPGENAGGQPAGQPARRCRRNVLAGRPFRPIPRGPYELPAAFVPARLVFSRDGSRLAVMNGPRDTEAAIDVWNLRADGLARGRAAPGDGPRPVKLFTLRGLN